MKLLCALLGHREGGPVYHGFILCPRCWKPVEHVNRRGWL